DGCGGRPWRDIVHGAATVRDHTLPRGLIGALVELCLERKIRPRLMDNTLPHHAGRALTIPGVSAAAHYCSLRHVRPVASRGLSTILAPEVARSASAANTSEAVPETDEHVAPPR